MTLFRLLSLAGLAAAFTGSALPVWAFPADLQPIAAALEQRGWKVLLEAPPRKGIYGMANSRKKTLWVHPITEAMGIMPQTFVHEAVRSKAELRKITVGYEPLEPDLKVITPEFEQGAN